MYNTGNRAEVDKEKLDSNVCDLLGKSPVVQGKQSRDSGIHLYDADEPGFRSSFGSPANGPTVKLGVVSVCWLGGPG